MSRGYILVNFIPHPEGEWTKEDIMNILLKEHPEVEEVRELFGEYDLIIKSNDIEKSLMLLEKFRIFKNHPKVIMNIKLLTINEEAERRFQGLVK